MLRYRFQIFTSSSRSHSG